MEIKATLDKPYTERQRVDFIVEQNHRFGYEVRETALALEAWGLTDEEKLAAAKERKYNEANSGAREYIENEADFEFDEGKHIEATDGNIAKLGLSLVSLILAQNPELVSLILAQDTETTIPWNTKEDENVELNMAQLTAIVDGLKAAQAEIWTVKFPYYLALIEAAQTTEEVNAIDIDYSVEVPEPNEEE